MNESQLRGRERGVRERAGMPACVAHLPCIDRRVKISIRPHQAHETGSSSVGGSDVPLKALPLSAAAEAERWPLWKGFMCEGAGRHGAAKPMRLPVAGAPRAYAGS